MNKKERFFDVDNTVEWRHIITLMFVLVAMAGQAQQVHYRLEGFVGDSTVTGKASIIDMVGEHSGETICTVNITKGIIEPKEGELSDTTICMLILGEMSEDHVISSTFNLYPIFLGGGTTRINGRIGIHTNLSGNAMCEDATTFFKAELKSLSSFTMDRMRNR